MNPNTAMANMNPMGGAVAGAPMPMMNNATANQQAGAAAAAARQQQMSDNQRGVLNTYIYEYFIRYGMFDCARSLLSSDQQVNVLKDVAHRRNEGGNAVNGLGDDAMDTDAKDDVDAKLPDDLPPPKLPMPASDTSFLYEWFCLFWDIYNAQRAKGGNGTVNQYVAHTQELFRQMRPEMAQQQYQAQMARMQNGGMGMAMKPGNLARAAMANNQSNPQMQMLAAQAKQNQMQRDPSQMEGNRGDRPNSPAAGENAPSPSAKRPRLDSAASFNGNQPGAMMPNGNAVQGMAGQQTMNSNANVAAAHQMLVANGINPTTLTAQQLNTFINSPQSARQKSIATYSHNLQQHHGNQMGNNKMPNAAGPQNQGSPMVPQGADGTAISAFYNPGEMGGPGGIRPGPGGTQATAGSNHALQDYQMQLMLLEQQNKKRLMMARQEQDNLGQQGTPGQTGPNGQPFPDGSPQAVRAGASPNPADQAKRGTPQMNNSGIPSPVPEGGQSRDSPNPGMNFMNVDPNMSQHFFKNMDGTMGGAQGQMNGMRPPSSHPGQPFNNQQMMAAARQQGGPTTPQQWQQGPNGQIAPQNMQQGQQMQGTPQQRAMPPPSAPAAANSASNATNNRTTASPQQATAAPPTPNQSTKPAPKKKETKAQKEKRAAAAKKNQQNNANNTNNAEGSTDQEAPAPATPITPANSGLNKSGPNAGNAQANTGAPTTSAAATTTAPQTAPVPGQVQGDTSQNGGGLEFNHLDFNSMDIANPLQSGDVLNDFDFDSFLHDGDGSNEPFDFNGAFSGIDGGEIGAE